MPDSATQESGDDQVVSACLDLEPMIRDTMLMSSIAAFLAHEALDGMGKIEGDYHLIKILSCNHERLLFAVQKAADMTEELDETFHAIWKKDAKAAA